MSDLRFFNPYAEIRHTENRLPHWQQAGVTYFLTFGLADAIPARLRYQWEHEREAWLKVHPEPWAPETEREYHKRFSSAVEQWLDAGYGACLPRQSDCAQIVADTLRHFERDRVVMNFFCCDAKSRPRAICSESGMAAGETPSKLEAIHDARNQ